MARSVIIALCLGITLWIPALQLGGLDGGPTTIQLLDASRPGGPVLLSGSVLVQDKPEEQLRYSYNIDILASNVSKKAILLLVSETDVTGAGGVDIHDERFDDYFFGPEFASDSREVLHISSGPYGRPQSRGGPQKGEMKEGRARASSRITFVEFVDGTSWGDPKVAVKALRERRLTMERLNSLRHIYETKGPTEFHGELLKPTESPSVERLQHAATNTDDQSLIKILIDMLSYAERHTQGFQRKNLARLLAPHLFFEVWLTTN